MNYKNIKSIDDVKLTTEYVPYITKVAECKNLADVTSHKEVAGKKIFSVNSTTRHLFYIMKLIQLYTDIEFGDDELVDAYDELCKKKVLYEILTDGGLIPNGELVEFKQIMDMVMDDLYENERSTSAILGNLKDSIGAVLETMLDSMVEVIDDQENQVRLDVESE